MQAKRLRTAYASTAATFPSAASSGGRVASAGDVAHAIEQFFELLGDGSLGPEEALLALVEVLDRLMSLARRPDYTFEAGHPPPPRLPDAYRTYRELAATHFATLDLYNVPVRIAGSVGEAAVGVGDPYDDIADIATDLAPVRWAFSNSTTNDALWHFHFGFDSHWGDHANNLRWYLYAREHDL